MVREGRFRDDLYYRLCTIEILLPPLRERPSDIPLLAAAFLRESAAANQKPVVGFSPDATEALQGYPWPGNVRELRSAVERAVILARGDTITLRDLPPDVRTATAPGTGPRVLLHPEASPAPPGPAKLTQVEEAERQLIIQALRETGGNRTEAARRIGLSRRTLHRKLHHYQLEGF